MKFIHEGDKMIAPETAPETLIFESEPAIEEIVERKVKKRLMRRGSNFDKEHKLYHPRNEGRNATIDKVKLIPDTSIDDPKTDTRVSTALKHLSAYELQWGRCPMTKSEMVGMAVEKMT